MSSGEVINGGAGGESAANSSPNWEIIHIPDNPPVLPHLQDTVDLLAAEIEPKHANTLVRRLNYIAPLENLRHVKRIRKKCLNGGESQLFVILCAASGMDGESTDMPQDVLELVNTYQLSTFNTKVCKYAALTKEEWEEQCKLWPTSFHPPTYNIDGITGFSDKGASSVFSFMKLAVHMAKSGTSTVNAAIIVDPSSGQVIASSCDQVLSRNALTNNSNGVTGCSLHLNATTDTDTSEMEKDSTLLVKKKLYDGVACLHPWRWPEQQLHSSSDSWHPLRHAAIVAIENSAARDRHLFPLNEHTPENGQEDNKVKDNVNLECQGNGHRFDSSKPYLCTGYDIYFVWEPCIMCAMAIVHQRVRRVFYAFPNENDGGLGSVHRLQGERSLNHHYAVFRVMLPEEILDP